MKHPERWVFRKAEASRPPLREGLFASCDIRAKCSFHFLRKSDYENFGD